MFLLPGINWHIKLFLWLKSAQLLSHESTLQHFPPRTMDGFSGLVSGLANERKCLQGFLLTDRLFEPTLNWLTGMSISMLQRRRRMEFLLTIHMINHLSGICVHLLWVFILHKDPWCTTVPADTSLFHCLPAQIKGALFHLFCSIKHTMWVRWEKFYLLHNVCFLQTGSTCPQFVLLLLGSSQAQ